MNLNSSVGYRLPKTTKRVLEKYAEREGLSLSAYLRLAAIQLAKTPFRIKKGRLSA